MKALTPKDKSQWNGPKRVPGLEDVPHGGWLHMRKPLSVIASVASPRGHHISVSRHEATGPQPASDDEAQWVLSQFGLPVAHEDNSGAPGFARHFWQRIES